MQKLYKFMPVSENNYGSIGNASLWFSDVRKFNDPFEGLFALDMPQIKDVKLNDLRYLSARYVELVRQAGVTDAKSINTRLSKDENYAVLRPYFAKILEGIRNHFMDSLGACCFVRDQPSTQVPRGVEVSDRTALHHHLMWSHYADGLRGLCIEFDGEKLIDGLQHLNPSHEIASVEITYTDQRPRINVWDSVSEYIKADKDNRETLTGQWLEQTSKKPQHWKYENEIRFRALGAVNKNLKYPPDAISKVVFGQKMSPVHRFALKRLFTSLGVPNSNMYDICIHDLHYQFNLNPVVDI